MSKCIHSVVRTNLTNSISIRLHPLLIHLRLSRVTLTKAEGACDTTDLLDDVSADNDDKVGWGWCVENNSNLLYDASDKDEAKFDGEDNEENDTNQR